MLRSPTIGLSTAATVLIAGVALCGCAWAPVSAGPGVVCSGATQAAVAKAVAPVAAESGPAGGAGESDPALPGHPGASDPQAMQQVIAEIQALGELDPRARDELLKNLQQTDPRIWPLVVQQVRATVAWRQQEARREVAALSGEAWPDGSSLRSAAPSVLPAASAPAGGASLPALGAGLSTPPKPNQAAAAAPATGPLRLDTSNPAYAAAYTPESRLPLVPAEPGCGSAERAASPLDAAIQHFEAAVSRSPQSEEEIAQHVRLRMLYLLAGRRDEALRPIPSMDPAMQGFWSEQLFGLATLIGDGSGADHGRHKAEAKQHFDAAASRLGETCPLVVRNLAFVTDIQSFGTYQPFEKYEFVPGQRVLLYAEVENFKSAETPKGFHTATRSSYQIFDSAGRRVAEHEFAESEEYCRQPRRDFFIGYEFCLPQRIYPGRHVLQLTVADLNGEKLGQSQIEFTVKPGDE